MVDGTFLLFINQACGIIPNKYHLLTKGEVIRGKSQTKALMYWLSNSEVNTSRPRSDISLWSWQTRLISYLLYGLFFDQEIMDLSLACNKLKPVTGKKEHITSVSCTLEPVIQSCDTGQWIPFWQLSIDRNMDVYKDIHYQVKHRLYMAWTSS